MEGLPVFDTPSCVSSSTGTRQSPGAIRTFWIMPLNASCYAKLEEVISSSTGSCSTTSPTWRLFLFSNEATESQHDVSSPGTAPSTSMVPTGGEVLLKTPEVPLVLVLAEGPGLLCQRIGHQNQRACA